MCSLEKQGVIHENCSSNFCGWRLSSEEDTFVPAVYSVLECVRGLLSPSLSVLIFKSFVFASLSLNKIKRNRIQTSNDTPGMI